MKGLRMPRRRFLGAAGVMAGCAAHAMLGGLPPVCAAGVADVAEQGRVPDGAVRAPGGAGTVPGGPAMVPGRPLRFPDDEGAHPAFRTEWWYVTGWLAEPGAGELGFQVTFFRSRALDTAGNPSRFAPAQLYAAHAALSDPRHGALRTMQRLARGGFGLVGAAEGQTDVVLDDWSLRADGQRLLVRIPGREFGFDFALLRTQSPLLQGDAGASRKGPAPDALSGYYTLPHLALEGTLRRGAAAVRVTGRAWLDHEWSSTPMDPAAIGWDWAGINLDDGGALMVFRMRGEGGSVVWAGGTLRAADGRVTTFGPADVRWEPLRQWRSPRTDTAYPIAWRVRAGDFECTLLPLFDDQENDARASTGTVYWEGAVTARSGSRVVGRGYLELTGYWRAFRL